MIEGFYELLGVEQGTPVAEVRAAYGRAIAKLVRRRNALVEQGGDTAKLDLAREALDEAWEVLSDPVRRRRYDAMLAWAAADHPHTEAALWREVGPVLGHPAAAVAAKLLRVTTHLAEIGSLPLGPSAQEDAPPTLVPHDEDLTSPRPIRLGRMAPPPDAGTASVVELPTAANSAPEPSLRVVDGSPDAPSVIVLPTDTPRHRTLSADDLTRLVDAHGYSGAMLRAVRDARDITLQQMADTTRISVRYLEAIEADRFEDLPSSTFVRGYVREMARMLKLDDDATVAGYMRRFSG